MPTQEQMVDAIRAADAAGDSMAVRKLYGALKQMQFQSRVAEQQAKDREQFDPTKDMSTTERFLAGAGKAFTDIARGAGQLVGVVDRKDIDEAKKLDAPLMATTAGKVGNVTGNVAAALPTVFIPGAAGLRGAAAVGAGMGALEPVGTDDSRLRNMATGAAAGAGGVAVARGVAAAAKGAKALVEPLTAKGQQTIAARTMERFGITEGDLLGVGSGATITGARPTLAERIARPEGAAAAAKLQDAVRVADPEIAAKLAAREVENNAARVNTLRDLAGTEGQREFYDASRKTAAKELYDKAFGVKLDPTLLTPAERGEITKLMKMPAIADAMKQAQMMAQNQGQNLGNKAAGSIEGLHVMKQALDDQVSSLMQGNATQVNKAMSIAAARDRLLTFIERMSPEYGEARATYAAMSKPLNQMDVAGEVLKRGTSATSDLAGNPRLMPDALARTMQDEGRLIKNATGRDLPQKTLADLLDPDQLKKLTAVAKETDRAAAVGRAANGPGSATAQRMASQNIMRQVLGPLGLPQSWAESTMLGTLVGKPLNVVYGGVAEPKIQAVLADLVMNPARAQQVMQLGKTMPQKLSPELRAALPYLEQALRVSTPAAALAGQR